ncbi:unnamed protein product [Rotaria sp. Silwood1]|nr:unnamed protein product [Rotaria sp. Silwood1]CAF1645951.1 unnamed protein product [Rotaria sp. Silwood1]CAF3761114.1 unnamed protein product [Rotaria sp. Silwood1]CAF3826641.1 unnamed protein product [Rotaria sp. Silwood1]CAF4632205.1 unnamed protein product [Rotaria sp. Silwood1]
MTTQSTRYDDKPHIVSYDDNGIRTTTTTTKLDPDPNEKPKETVTVRTIQHPDSTETVTVTEKKLPPIRYTETITREKLPKKNQTSRIQITQPTQINETTTIPPVISDTYITNEIPPPAKTYNIVRRERIVEEPNTIIYPTTRQDRVIVTQPERITTPRVIIRSTPEPTSYIQVQNPRTTRFVDVRQATSPVIVDVGTPPITTTTTKKTTIINDNVHDTLVDDRRTLVNYQDDYYRTRRVGQRSEWCGNCGADCLGCDCFDDCCGSMNCCRTNTFARRKDVVSYRTRVTKDGRHVRYRNADVPGYRCCNCCTGWCSRFCPCCSCLEWFCACPCWLWLCCLLPLLLGLLGLSIGLLTQLPSITSNTNNIQTLRVIEQVVNETWYIYGLDQPCQGSATTFPPSLSTITTLIPCAQTTTSWARIIQATTLITINKTINSNSNQYNELRVTQTYNTVLAVLGQNAVCQPDRNLPGVPLYCDQTTTSFSITATSSSSTVFAIQVNGSNHIDYDSIFIILLSFQCFIIQKYFQLIIRSIFIY